MFENAEIVKIGKFKYGNIWCCIKIIKWDVIYGTGDYEDEDEVANDREIKCYYVLRGNGVDNTFGISEGYRNLEEAIRDGERYEVIWEN